MNKVLLIPTPEFTNGLATDICNILENDQLGDMFEVYMYAITNAGLSLLINSIENWKNRHKDREVVFYVGTDHCLTEPAALELLVSKKFLVHLLLKYEGTYHPKLYRLKQGEESIVWIGSNNLTLDGMKTNFEFATKSKINSIDPTFSDWRNKVIKASTVLTSELLFSYRDERKKFFEARNNKSKNNKFSPARDVFVWSRKNPPNANLEFKDEIEEEILVIEIMPLETSSDGNQVQIPLIACKEFFGLSNLDGATKDIRLREDSALNDAIASITVYRNKTARLVLTNLDLRDRPCCAVFGKKNNTYTYKIVRKIDNHDLYNKLMKKCTRQTSIKSRKWTILKKDSI